MLIVGAAGEDVFSMGTVRADTALSGDICPSLYSDMVALFSLSLLE